MVRTLSCSKFGRSCLVFLLTQSLLLTTASAKSTCESILSAPIAKNSAQLNWKPNIDYERYKSGLSAEALRKQGFRIDAQGNLYSLKDSTKAVGKVLVARPDYLFQWADEEYFQDLLKTGIYDEWMDLILKEPGQASGKGFYVSMLPEDSSNYGTHMTAFQISKPVFVLEYDLFNLSHKLKSDTEFVKKLAKAGIDGLRYSSYQKSWISMISNRHLLKAIRPPVSVLNSVFNASRTIPKDNSTHSIAFHNFSKYLISEPHSIDLDSFNSPYLKRLINDDLKSADIDQLVQNDQLNLLSEIILKTKKESTFKAILNELQAQTNKTVKIQNAFEIGSSQPSKELEYQTILNIFDFETVIRSVEKKLSQSSSFNQLKKSAKEYIRRQSGIPLLAARTSEDLIKIVDQLYDLKLTFRESPVVMKNEFSNSEFKSGSDSEDTYFGSKEELESLKENTFMTLSEVKRKKNNFEATVEYWKIEKTDQIPYIYMSPDLRRRIYEFLAENKSIDETSDEYRRLTKEAVTDITQKFVSRELQSRTYGSAAIDSNMASFEKQYKFLLSLHPFEDGNGRFARLFLSYKYQISSSGLHGTNLPIYNWDLFLNSDNFRSLELTGSVLKAWARKAIDDADFIARCRWALKYLSELHPELTL